MNKSSNKINPMEKKNIDSQFLSQDTLYNFPYHYIPQSFNNEIIKPFRVHYWLYDYLRLIKYLIERIKKIEGENILDFGCGDGRLINELKKLVRKNIFGYEISTQASKFFYAFNPEIELLNNLNVLKKYKNFFDVINFSEVIEHIPDKEVKENINAIYESLKPNGYLIVTAPHENFPVHKKHYRHYNFETLIANFEENKFTLIEKKFLFKTNIFRTIVRKFFFNRYFIINSNLLFKLFSGLNNFFFFSEEKKCGTIFLMLKKK